MKTMLLFVCFLSIGTAFAQKKKTPSKADEGFVSLFDGASLKGWRAPDMKYWSVEQGAITARCTAEMPCTENQFLVWQGGKPADFELVLQFRIFGDDKKANSGIQFRSQVEKDGHVVGYQADISRKGAPWFGMIYDEKGRGKIGPRAHDSLITSDRVFVHVPATPDEEIATAFEQDGWNEYRILAFGDYLELRINGVRTARVLDRDAANSDGAGLLALQLHSGPPMRVQFKDIRIREYR